MTAETSNARGEWVLVPREPSESMLSALMHAVNASCNRAEWYAHMLAAAPPPAAARGDVRGLVAKLAAHVRPTCSELWDEAQAFLAAEGVQAGEVEQRARELLAAEYERAGIPGAATDTRNRAWGDHLDHEVCIRAITSALSQQPEARGVVDEGRRIVTRQLLHWGGIPVHVTGTVTTSPGNWSLIDAALAAKHQEPTNG